MLRQAGRTALAAAVWAGIVHAAPEKVEFKAVPIPPTDVRLRDGPLKRAAEINDRYLLELSADRLLSGSRSESGLEPKGPKYGGWESKGVHSHILGHYLSALALRYAMTGDARFKERLDYAVGELAACQKAAGDGRLLGMPEGVRVFKEVAAGNIRARGFNLNDCWVPLYTMHKVLAGLRDAHRWGGSAQALEVERGMADWFGRILDGLKDAQIQNMLGSEQGGINEVYADLYADTGDERYLKLAARLNQKGVLDPLMKREDRLNGLHANTQIPKVIGLARQYELSADPAFRTGAEFFWDRVANFRSYVIGGNSDSEHFFPVTEFGDHIGERGRKQAESCNTYNMLKLTTHIFAWTGEARYMDYYERALFNHILAHIGPQPGQFVYYLSQTTGDRKPYSKPYDDFWCCVGTGLENPGHYADAIYASTADTLLVNLFAGSEVKWKARGVTLVQDTAFPESNRVRLTVQAGAKSEWTLKIRAPAWLAGPMQITVGGKAVTPEVSGGYASLKRTWSDGDVVDVVLPMNVRTELLPGTKDVFAVLYGPTVLVAVMEKEGDASLAVAESLDQVPARFEREAPERLAFRSAQLLRPRDLKFIPLYQVTGERYAVYFPLVTPAALEEREKGMQERNRVRKEQETRRTDVVEIGFQQSEVDHGFENERSRTGEIKGRKWRDAERGGWFSYRMAVDPAVAMEIGVTYSGSDKGRRVFDILVDGERTATVELKGERPEPFYEASYPVPEKLTQGKKQVTVRFQAQAGAIAGGVFGLEIRRQSPVRP